MKLIISFGHDGCKREVDWYRDLHAFPKLIKYQGLRWEWAMYNTIGNTSELTFSKIPAFDPNFNAEMPSFEDMFEYGHANKCCCGAIYSSFSWDHLRYCPMHKPWSQI